PKLKVGILESGVHWIEEVVNRIDLYWRTQSQLGLITSYRGELSPREQWRRQCFVSTTFDANEIALRRTLGVSTMMWGSDFPHIESTYPKSREFLARTFAGVPDEEVDAIVCGNAVAAMGFDLEKLRQTPAARVPWPQQIGETHAEPGSS